jgi:glycosyltransferase involved in cell wall biosynthesis
MACGHAPIVTERASLRDYNSPGVATTVPPNDPVALRRAIDGALADHPRAVAMGAAARRHIENGFTTRDFAERLARVLREVT